MLGPRWPQKPPVGTPLDPSHPLTTGLVGYWPLNEGTGLPYNIAGAYATQAGAAAPAWVATVQGPGLSFNGTSQDLTVSSSVPSLSITGPLTIACGGALHAATASCMIYHGYPNSSPYNGYGLSMSEHADVAPSVMGKLSYWNGVNWYYASAAQDGNWHVHAVSQATAAGSGADIAFYLDGAPNGTASTSAFPPAYSGTRYIGSNSSGEYLKGTLGWLAIWSRALLPAEHAQLAADPWRVFRPRRDVRSLPAARSGAGPSYPRGSSILRPLQLPTADLTCYVD